MNIYMFILVFGLFAVICAKIYAMKLSTERLQKRETNVVKFFESVKPLMTDDETPKEVLDMIDFLNYQIGNDRAATEFVLFLREKAAEPASQGVRKNVELIHDFLRRRSELKQSYSDALSYGLLAMCYNGSVLYGTILRLWISNDIGPDLYAKPRSESILSRVKEIGNGSRFLKTSQA